ncbi:AAA family ATPase [Deinococcus oregonensis]|uniref:AAA family ATPase n=1 Tax=Deinococcus oregonensis TaxID=1805970 RepID=A0ABV6AZD7_9DEIO
MPTGKLEIQLLGVPCVTLGRLEITPAVRKGMALIAYLALEGPTDRHQLADLLWTNLNESDARRNLRQELWRLQRTPLAAWLNVRPGSLSLSPDIQVDVTEFHRLLGAAELGTALALYREPLMAQVELSGAAGFDDWLADRRADLNGVWKAALQRHGADLEHQGDLRGALSIQLQLLQDDEFQEVCQREAMRLNLLLGERAEGLRRFERYSRMLGDELGLKPLPETLALAQLLQNPGRGGAAPSPTPDPRLPQALSLPLIGRSAEWLQLQESSAALTLVTGEPGVGKTRLTEAFASTFGVPLRLRAFEVSIETPLYPAAEAIRAALATARMAERLETLDPLWRAEAARLVPELGAAPESALQPDGRARFLNGVAATLSWAVTPQGVLVFDDLHWADPMTVELLLHLARQPLERRPRLIATARSRELSERPQLTAALQSLERENRVCRISLGGLGSADVLTLVQVMSGSDAGQRFASRLFEATSGNPLYLLESLRYLFELGTLRQDQDGHWSTEFDESTSDYSELPLPESVRDAIVQRVMHYGAAARRLLEAASLCDEGFSLDDLAPALSLSDWEAVETLERLLEAGLVARLGAERYGFSHDLVRRVLLQTLGSERRRLIHRRLAEQLEDSGAAASRIARHLEEAGQRLQAAPWRVRAAEEAARVYAHSEALNQYALALENGLEPREAFAVRSARTELFQTLGNLPARGAELETLADLARTLGDAGLQADVQLNQIRYHLDAGHHLQALATTEQLLAGPGLTAAHRAAGLRMAGHTLGKLGRLQEGERQLHEALEEAAVHATDLLPNIHNDLSNLTLELGKLDIARRHNEIALSHFQSAGNARGHAVALNSSARIAHMSGDGQRAQDHLNAALRVSRTLGDLHLQTLFLNNLVRLQVDLGQLDQALAALNEGLAVVSEPRSPVYEGLLRSRAGDVQRLKGELGAALEHDLIAISLADEIGAVTVQITRRVHLSRFLLQLGDLSGAGERLREARELNAAARNSELHLLLELGQAELELCLGDPLTALQRLEQAAGGPVPQGESGALLRVLRAAACLALGRVAQAAEAQTHLPARPALRAQALTVRLRTAHGTAQPDDEREAQALLAAGHVPPLEALALQLALAARVPAEPRSGQLAATLQHQLSASLAPERRAAFNSVHRAAGQHENAGRVRTE